MKIISGPSVIVAAFLGIGPAQAADPADLYALRDAMVPDTCTSDAVISTHQTETGQIHVIPCAPTAQSRMDMVVMERGGTLIPLTFATPLVTPSRDALGNISWDETTLTGFSATVLVSEPEIAAQASLIRTYSPIPPGLGGGHITDTYRLDPQGPTHESSIAETDAGGYHLLWPAYPAPAQVDLTLEHNLNGFNVREVPDLSGPTPLAVLDQIDVGFPTDGEEGGRPGLSLELSETGAKIAVNLTESGWADDSVKGQVYRVLMERKGDGWRVTGLGHAWLCYRGEKSVTTDACP